MAKKPRLGPPDWSPRHEYAARAMVVLMSGHPDSTRGWIAEMAIDMADVILEREARQPVNLKPDVKFDANPRVFAEDEPEL